MHPLNQYIDHIYVLYISQQELDRIKPKIEKKKLTVEYVEGVNGLKAKNTSKLQPGAFGHTSSFIKILQDAKEKEYNKILILEPDIYFSKDFDESCEEYLKRDWQILYLGASQYMYYKEKTWDRIQIKNDYYFANRTLGTFAIAFDKSIINEYLDMLKQFKEPSDVCLVKLQETHHDKCIVTYPNLICCNLVKSSTGNAVRPKQIESFERYRWSREYDLEDEYVFKTDKNSWYRIFFDINSYIDNKYSITVGSLPTIRQFKLLSLIYNTKEPVIYFHASEDSTKMILNNFFCNFKVDKIDNSTIKKMLNGANLAKIKDHPLNKYYNDRLNRAFTSEKI